MFDNKIKSHKQTLKSTGIVGGTQVFSIIIGAFRTKIIAILLGPAGVGYIGMLQTIIDLVRQTTEFGINFSGVKEIAEANATNDEFKISRKILILRRWSFVTGLIGMILTILLCVPLSNFSFGNNTYSISIALISVVIFLNSVSSGQIALLQGLRKISEMAKATLLGAIFSTIVSIPLYWWLGIKAIVPSMIITSLISIFISWMYTKKIKTNTLKLSFNETFRGGLKMVKLGLFIIITSLFATATMYLVRAFLAEKMDLAAVGCFQACWTISNMYLGILLNSMLSDFFPRLTAISKDNKASNILINEQIEIVLLIGSPMLISIIVFSSLIIKTMYSSSFNLAIQVLQFQIFGSFFSLISWALGVMFLAKNKGSYSFFTEGIWSIVYLVFVYFGWDYFGFLVLGIAYVFASILRLIIVYKATIKLGDFSFTSINTKLIVIYLFLSILVLTNMILTTNIFQYYISAILILITYTFSFINFNKIINVSGFIKSKILKK